MIMYQSIGFTLEIMFLLLMRKSVGVSTFLLRGAEGAKAEMALLAGNFNIARMVNILGVETLIARLKGNVVYEMSEAIAI